MISAGRVLTPGDDLVAYHSAIDFSSYFGSIGSDTPIEYDVYFSNDEVDAEGHWVTDRALPGLHWDIKGKIGTYTPEPVPREGLWILMTGRWMKVQIKIGKVAPKELRFYLRGRTF